MGTMSDIASYEGVIFTSLCVLCVFIVYSYAERGQGFPWHTYLSCTICYFASFGIILLVPIDIATVVQDRQSTISGSDSTYSSNNAQVSKAYSTFFILVIVFAQLVMVFEEYYNCDGNFTIVSRLWHALLIMLRDIVLMLILGGIILGILIRYHVVQSDGAALQLTAVIVTNTIYEFFLMFLLGYGLINYPRRWWLDADIEGSLLRTQIKAASDFADIREGQVNMSIEYANAQRTRDKLESTPGSGKALLDAMQTIVQELPTEGFTATRSGEVAYEPKSNPPKITIRSLAALRTRINTARSQYRMALAKVEKTKLQAYHLEDLLESKKRNTPGSPTFDGVQRINWSLSGQASTTFEFQWYLKYKPWLLRLMAALWGLLSIFSFIGVVGSFNGVNVQGTPYFQAVHSDGASTGGIVIFIFVTFGYTVYITFWSLFQMRLGGLMDLVPGETTPVSLSFNARMIARLAAPLVFFYLGWLAENGCTNDVTPTWTYNEASVDPIEMTSSFANFYQLQQVPFIRKSFGTIFPSILIVFLVMVVTDFYNWLCVKLGAGWAQFGIPRVTPEQEREGKRRLVDDKKKTLNAARRKRMLSFLQRNNGAINDDAGPDGGGLGGASGSGGGGGLFSLLWGPSKALAQSEQLDGAAAAAAERNNKAVASYVRDVTPPADLGGLIEVKGAGRIFSSWKEWWAEVRAPGVLYFFTNRAPPPNFIDAAAPPPVELIDVIDFKIGDAGSSANTLRLLTSDVEVTLRFKSSLEADSWRRLLIEWKDFSVDHGQEYMLRRGRDVESSRTSGGPAFPGSGSVSSTMGVVSGSGLSSGGVSVSVSSSQLGEDKPRAVDTFVEMKGKGSGWERRYLRIDERSSSLIVTKSNGPSEKPLVSVHLPEVADIAASREYGGSYFDVQVDESTTYKFRAGSDAEGQKLAALINDWKDYLLLNMQG